MIARFYNRDANPDGAHFPGVPLRDLTDQEFEALPKHMQNNIDASPLYRKTKPSAAAKPRRSDADTGEKEAVNG